MGGVFRGLLLWLSKYLDNRLVGGNDGWLLLLCLFVWGVAGMLALVGAGILVVPMVGGANVSSYLGVGPARQSRRHTLGGELDTCGWS